MAAPGFCLFYFYKSICDSGKRQARENRSASLLYL